MSLYESSQNNVMNRAVVIHERTDDLGRGDSPQSLKNGNSGAIVACALIKAVEEFPRHIENYRRGHIGMKDLKLPSISQSEARHSLELESPVSTHKGSCNFKTKVHKWIWNERGCSMEHRTDVRISIFWSDFNWDDGCQSSIEWRFHQWTSTGPSCGWKHHQYCRNSFQMTLNNNNSTLLWLTLWLTLAPGCWIENVQRRCRPRLSQSRSWNDSCHRR